MRTNYSPTSDQNSDTAVEFSDPRFYVSYGTDILAIGGHLPAILAIFSLRMQSAHAQKLLFPGLRSKF